MVSWGEYNVGGGDELDTEDEGVEFESGDAEVVGDVNFVEAAPEAGKGFQWEGGHDLHTPVDIISMHGIDASTAPLTMAHSGVSFLSS